MKLTSAESLKILEYALKREEETGSFYKECHGKAKNSGAKEIMKDLAADEKCHADIVSNLIAEARKDSPAISIKTAETDNARKRLEHALKSKTMTDRSFSPETASVMDMLKKALAIEKESFDIYAKAAAEAEEDEIKAVYKFLSGEENKHYVIIDNLISYLDDPGRWLYEEENLVFRW